MLRRLFVAALLLTGGATNSRADEPNGVLSPTSTAPQKSVQLQIRWIERRENETSQIKGVSAGRVLDRAESKAFLEQLTSDSETRILAAPALRLALGQKGSFRNGGEFLRDLPDSNGNPPLQEAVFFGTAVDATVTMPKPGLLNVDFRCEQSDRVPAGKTGVPGLNQRVVETRVELRSGQSVLLAGLKSTRDVNSETRLRLPVLGDIPVVGHGLFAKRRTDKQIVELIMMVSAELVDEPAK